MSTAAASWWGALALPALAVVAVLFAGLLVVYYGLRPAPDPPAMDPALFEERRSKKKRKEPSSPKTKSKQSNGQVVHEPEAKPKKAPQESNKKSPTKSKEEKKPKEKAPEPKKEKVVEKKTPKKEVKEAPKKQKDVKPVDFDDGEWEKVTSRSDKKSRKTQEEKKESPVKEKSKNVKGNEEKKKASPKKVEPPQIPKDLQDKVNELQRVLNEVEKRDRSQTPVKLEEKSRENSTPTTPIVKEKKLPEVDSPPPPPKTQKAVKKQASNDSDEGAKKENGAVFDELGDTWTDAKIQKKGKKKPRKDQ